MVSEAWDGVTEFHFFNNIFLIQAIFLVIQTWFHVKTIKNYKESRKIFYETIKFREDYLKRFCQEIKNDSK